MSFNESQSKAICHTTGPALVLAGPGSGKTLVLTHRIKHLIEECGVNPSNILVITFTKAAANEMQERFEKLSDKGSNCVTFGTFHAVFFKILKYAYSFSADNILREDQRLTIIREIIDKHELEIDDMNEFVSGILSEISCVKGEMISLDSYYSKNCAEEIFKKIFKDYDSRLRRSNLVDFDDMLVMCYELLTKRADILNAWQNKYKYILIDEFQDINRVQYEVIKLLALPENNIFIVGDDDQSIYRFRGAKPEIMLNFEKDYKNCKKILLDINYRSTPQIVKASGRVIKNNKNRFDKQISANNSEGDNVIIKTFKEPKEESDAIVQDMYRLIGAGYSYTDMAVIYRTNTGPRALLQKVMEYNIPFHMKDSLPNIYEHWIAKNIIAYINIAMGSTKRSDYLQIINRPKRYIARDLLSTSEIDLYELKMHFKDKDWMVLKVEQLEYNLSMLSQMNPYSAINYIRNGIGYESYLKEYADYRRIKAEELIEVLDELMESAKGYNTYSEWFMHIEAYGEALRKQIRDKNINKEGIELTTMHSSKGLEYKIVFIIDANEGVTPHNKAFLEEDMEEERRMFYVAMTRAKEKLYVYNVQDRYGKSLMKSRFVGEILCDMEDYKVDTIILHKKYGEGKIIKVDLPKAEIWFPSIRKKLVIDIKYTAAEGIIKI